MPFLLFVYPLGMYFFLLSTWKLTVLDLITSVQLVHITALLQTDPGTSGQQPH